MQVYSTCIIINGLLHTNQLLSYMQILANAELEPEEGLTNKDETHVRKAVIEEEKRIRKHSRGVKESLFLSTREDIDAMIADIIGQIVSIIDMNDARHIVKLLIVIMPTVHAHIHR